LKKLLKNTEKNGTMSYLLKRLLEMVLNGNKKEVIVKLKFYNSY